MLDVKAALEDSFERLKEEYDIEEVGRIPIYGEKREKCRMWRIAIPTEVGGKAELIDIYLIFVAGFPYEMPAMIVPDDRFKYLPHISSDTRKLCLYEDDIVYDAENIYGLLRDNINKVKHWIRYYTNRDNTDEYALEIGSYWNESYDGEDDVAGYWTFVGSIPTQTCELRGISYTTGIGNKGESGIRIVVMPKQNDMGVLDHLSKLHNVSDFESIFLSSVKIPVQPPYTLTGKGFINSIQNIEDQKVFKRYINRYGKGYVLFSIGINNVLGGVQLHNLNCNRNGFRIGSVTPYEVLSVFEGKNKKLPRMIASVYSDTRIAERTAGMMMSKRSFLIAGLGSIGSNLCYYLNGYNNAQFALVDKDKLNPENIGRHLLGFENQHQFKAIAVQRFLKQYRPDREVTATVNILQEISCGEINKSDAIFLCTGDLMSEQWLLHNMMDGVIKKTAFILWLEPYGVSGIMIYVNPNDRESLEKLSAMAAEGFKSYCIIAADEYQDEDKLVKREVGCNGKYAIYSANDVTFFLSAVFPVIDQLLVEPNESKCYRWVGNVDIARQKGISLSASDLIKHTFQKLDV